jgi:subtilase family serine protease
MARRSQLHTGARAGVLLVIAPSALAALALAAFALAVSQDSALAAARPRPIKITFYLGLKRPEAGARSAFFAVQEPGSARYRRFLTPAQNARRYGASAATKAAVLRAIQRLGLSARIDRSGVFARVQGTVAQMQRAFAVRLRHQEFFAPHSVVYSITGRPPRLPSALRRLVREVVTISARSLPPVRGAASRPRSAWRSPYGTAAATAPGNVGTWTGGCNAARATGAYSFAQVRDAYGIDRAGSGAGGSVAFLTDAEGPAPQDIVDNERCFGLPRGRVRTLLTDAQTRPFPRSSFEPVEDLALIRGIAPGLRSVLVAEAWGTESLWFLAPAKLLTLARLPETLSISYGFCERTVLGKGSGRVNRAGIALLDSLLLRLGLAAVGTFASAGDSGSSCNGLPFRGVAWPGSSPYLTSVGGSRLVLNAANQRVNEFVWNDLPWLSAGNGGGAGGGGVSAFYGRPPYQRRINIRGRGRGVPDVAAHASMLPGWPVVLAGNWIEDAGTSASAPLVASAFAIVSAAQRAARRPPLGPVDGLLYWLRRHRSALLFDIVSGSNRYFRKVPGWTARPGYDLASGVGVPQFERLAAGLPRPGR